MILIHWQGQPLRIVRLVVRPDLLAAARLELNRLADQLYLDITDDTSEARIGDFWLGTYPRAGWRDTDPTRIGWANALETPLALALLQRAVPHSAAQAVRADQPVLLNFD
jgi:hypothetical protein